MYSPLGLSSRALELVVEGEEVGVGEEEEEEEDIDMRGRRWWWGRRRRRI